MKSRTGSEVHELVDLLLASDGLHSFLRRLAEVCSEDLSLGRSVHCSVTVVHERRRDTMGASDGLAVALDAIQYGTGEGPCQDAAITGQPVLVGDLGEDPRYPRFWRAMASTGIRSVFATPIPLPASCRAGAALNCYSPEVDGFSADDRQRARELAALASKSVLLAVRVARAQDRTAAVEAALESRTAIDLALGVIMAKTGCTQSHAIEILTTASMNRNEELREVAASVLTQFDSVGAAPSFS